ncbi:MAG: transcriptional regulator GlxA family with amidase domain [Maricaulis maris]|jgi:transcriptional regulator GlxA family with amidase domain
MSVFVGYTPYRICADHLTVGGMSTKRKIRIGFLIFDGLQALDLFGPQEVFAEANACAGRTSCEYDTVLISPTGKSVTTESGIVIGAHASFDTCPALHTLIIPGGSGTRATRITQDVIDWINEQSGRTERIGSVCTGLFILARTGLLDGRTVTTHWKFVEEAQQQFPGLSIEPDALFIRDGQIITAAGITAGIDMSLALVEEDLGAATASEIARNLVVFLRRPGGQNQFSSLLRRQSVATDKFSELLVWISDNLTEDLSVEALANRACLSERHFRRSFKAIYNESPAQAVERIRVDIAKNWLMASSAPIAEVALLVGFRSADAFRRVFERLTSINPSEYRRRFSHKPHAR